VRNVLRVSAEEARRRIDLLVQRGEELLRSAQGVSGRADWEEWERAIERWQQTGKGALATTFEATDEADEFDSSATRGIYRQWGQSEDETFTYQVEALKRGLNTLESLKERLEFSHPVTEPVSAEAASADGNKIFVVHGRNVVARDAMFDFLRSIGLHPIDWSEAVKLTGKGAPYVGEILDAAFAEARAVVVLLTPDEVAQLRREYAFDGDEPDLLPTGQARPNVLFEAGMALGREPDRTVIVQLGDMRDFSDIAGRHTIRVSEGGQFREEIALRLETAGCPVDLSHDDWRETGDFAQPSPIDLASEAVLGSGVPQPTGDASVRVNASYSPRDKGVGVLSLTNRGSVDLYDLRIELPDKAGSSFQVFAQLPLEQLPVGETIGFLTARTFGPGADHFELSITARTSDGQQVATEAFVNLVT